MPFSGEHWHLDKKVPISIILTVFTQAAVGIWAIADIKKDVEVLKTQVLTQRDRDDRQDRVATDTSNLIRIDIKEVSQKLDRLIEQKR